MCHKPFCRIIFILDDTGSKMKKVLKTDDERYMRRALQLAAMGGGDASPNPRVGAVIVADDKIIGEGFHRRCGGPHAEVNAVNSVADRSLLERATIYVTLEPCAHYGKTPPCAKLLIDCKIPRVVIGSRDPFAKVDGKGISMLREAGADVKVGVLEDECRALNDKFMTAHTLRRPFVTLKWAETADGFCGALDAAGNPRPLAISNPLSRTGVHHLRSMHDAIMIGSGTALADNPSLDTRFWCGPEPRIIVADRRGRVSSEAKIMQHPDVITLNDPNESIEDFLGRLYSDFGITSLLVEGGPMLIGSFLKSGCYDCIRREISRETIGHGIPAPELPASLPQPEITTIRDNIIEEFNVKNL